MDDDDEDAIVAMHGDRLKFDSIAEAADVCREFLEDGGVFEIHASECDGARGPECDCGVQILGAGELLPKATA